MIAGFSVGGVDWPKPELIGVADPVLRRQIQRQVAFHEAAITHQVGARVPHEHSAQLPTADGMSLFRKSG